MLSLTVLALLGGSASAQSLLPGLPEVQAINVSGQVGTIWPSRFSTVPRTRPEDFDLWGWGETEFHLAFQEGSRWEGSLAVGYNQLSLSADIDKGRRLRGTLRDLPALSLYVGRTRYCNLQLGDHLIQSIPLERQLVKRCNPGGWYFGVTIAESELINGRLVRKPDPGTVDPGPIKIAAGSFSAGAAVGYEYGPVFVELGYVGRYFPSLAYDGIPPSSSFPADLGQRMYAGGFVLRVGATLDLKKSDPPKITISCAGASAEVSVPAGRRHDVHCKDDVLNVYVPNDPPATPPNK